MPKTDCPSCGAPIDFKSPVSILTVCDSCRSTLVRHDLNLENIGRTAELKLDGSPLQLRAEGRYKGIHFTAIGRIQLRFDQGIWNEWHLLFDDGRSGWLGEAQGTYVVTFLTETKTDIPTFQKLQIGQRLMLQGQSFEVRNRESSRCTGFEGELPFKVTSGYEAPVIDLLGDDGGFATLDYSEEAPLLFLGEYVEFDELDLSNLRPFDDDPKSARPKVKTFRCLKCGSAITLRGMLQTTSVVCSSCGSVIDLTDENMRIISAFESKIQVKPAIPLGSLGRFKDGLFEVIGFMRRVIFVEGVGYRWREYLLFNPFKGFRWLSEYNGHWSYIKTIQRRPRLSGATTLNLDGTTFRHFQSAEAKVDYVIGEFYWRIEAGESCLVQDYIAPPQILSMEKTDDEVTFSLGEYMEPEDLVQAFALTTSLPARIGVGANQPSPYAATRSRMLRLAAVFFVIAVFIQFAAWALSENKLVYQTQFPFDNADTEKSRVTGIFELDGRPSNVLIRTKADVSNNWIFLSMALINDDTGTAYDFGREISYYFGSDSEGSWTEGRQSDDAFLPAIPAGRYYLRIEPDGPISTQYSILVYRDVPRWWPFLTAVALILAFPVMEHWRSRNFEYQRWSESDHPMMKLVKFGSGDDE